MITREQIETNLKEIISRRKQSAMENVPEGWVTVKTASEICGLGLRRTQVYLSAAVQNGDVSKKSFRICIGKNSVRGIVHYFLGKKLK